MSVTSELNKLANPEKAKLYARYFKTGKDQYGYGDKFLGLTVPQQRKIAKTYTGIELSELAKILKSKVHEHRFSALVILVSKYKLSGEREKKKITDFYLKNREGINNWDLVDISAPRILGEWLYNKKRKILFELAKSKNLWDRRIAVLSTFAFIRRGDFADSLKIAKMLLSDKHDLIHKAVGWMLREIGNRSHSAEKSFLDAHLGIVPRTTLRYAIEKFNQKERQRYLRIKKSKTRSGSESDT